jgi:hypothetical protein
MAKATSSSTSLTSKPKKKRSGVHSKTKCSVSKNAKHYKKSYKGQGR